MDFPSPHNHYITTLTLFTGRVVEKRPIDLAKRQKEKGCRRDAAPEKARADDFEEGRSASPAPSG